MTDTPIRLSTLPQPTDTPVTTDTPVPPTDTPVPPTDTPVYLQTRLYRRRLRLRLRLL